jgi:hypothetical protein
LYYNQRFIPKPTRFKAAITAHNPTIPTVPSRKSSKDQNIPSVKKSGTNGLLKLPCDSPYDMIPPITGIKVISDIHDTNNSDINATTLAINPIL